MGCRRFSAASRLEVLLDEDDYRSSSRALERGNFLLLSTTACDNPGTLKSMSISSSWVNCCSPTGLPVHDNWVFGFGWIRWVSLLLPATSGSNSFLHLSLKEIVGGGRGDTKTFTRFHHNNCLRNNTLRVYRQG